jgi:hypothetical protein
VDIHGVAKTKAVPVEHFEDISKMERASPVLRCGVWDRSHTIPTTWRSAISIP